MYSSIYIFIGNVCIGSKENNGFQWFYCFLEDSTF